MLRYAVGLSLTGCGLILGFDRDVVSIDEPDSRTSIADSGASSTASDASSTARDGATEGGSEDQLFTPDTFLDPTFGTAGRIIVLGFPANLQLSQTEHPCAAALGPDEALWFACDVTEDISADAFSPLYRVPAGGAPERHEPPRGTSYAALAVEPAGVLAPGAFATNNQVVRILANGGVDSAFGSPSVSVPTPTSVISGLTSDGVNGYLVWGIFGPSEATAPNAFVARLTSGTPPSFTSPQKTASPITSASKGFTAGGAVRTAADTVLLFGDVGPLNGTRSPAVVRFVSGVLDPSFGVNGTAKYTPETSGTHLGAAASDSDHKIVIATSDDLTVSRIVRFLPADGSLDATFGTGGVVHFDPPATAPFGANHFRVQVIVPLASGKLLVAGHIFFGSGVTRSFVARLQANGSPDVAFGRDGFLYPRISTDSSFDEIRALVVAPDNGIVAVGTSFDTSGNVDFFALRFSPQP